MEQFPQFEPIPLDFDEAEVPLCRWPDGPVRLRTSRLLFELIAGMHVRGESTAEMAEAFSSLSEADAEAIGAWCDRHPAEVTHYLAEVERRGRLIERFMLDQGKMSVISRELRSRRQERDAKVPH
jgi:hypothetical protein